jgi:HrpA-like RNA helicase
MGCRSHRLQVGTLHYIVSYIFAVLTVVIVVDQVAGMKVSEPVKSAKKTKGEKKAAAAAAVKNKTAPAPNTSQALPIDAYREEILLRIRRDRVTIIHGETGEDT